MRGLSDYLSTAKSNVPGDVAQQTTTFSQTTMPTIHADDVHDLITRDFASQVSPNATQRTTLIVAGVYIIIIAILWCVVPVFSYEGLS